MKNYITKEGERVYKKVRDYFKDKFENSKFENEKIKIVEQTTDTLFKMAEEIKKEYNLKF